MEIPMEIGILVLMAVISAALLFAIAAPERILPDVPNKKKKKVGSSYWGVYKDRDPEKSVGEIEVKPLAGTQRTVYGANSYAKGKGVSRRGA